MRLFWALPLPEPARRELEAWSAALRPLLPPPIAWSRPEGWHLTLAFLGETDPARLPELEALGAGLAARHRAFPLRGAGPGAFPSDARARVLWLGFEPEPALEALAANLRGALAGAGLAFDPKPFRAHLTLARLKVPRRLPPLPAPPPLAFEARRLELLESVPGAGYRARVALDLARTGG